MAKISGLEMARLNKQQGFTLIEVLVAGFILFLVISATTLVYRGAALSSQKAEQTLYINGILPLILDEVAFAIQEKGQGTVESLQSSGEMAETNYQWTAVVVEFLAAPPKIIAEAGIVQSQPKRFKTWQVSLSISYKGYERALSYQELSWNEQLY